MGEKIDFIKLINKILLIAMFAFYSYSDAVYEAKGLSAGFVGYIKYVLLFLGILFIYYQLYAEYQKKKASQETIRFIYMDDLLRVLFVVFVFTFISIFQISRVGIFGEQTIVELIKILLPCIYAFAALNVLDFKDIYECMTGILIFAIVGYILEIGVDKFTISNILSINFAVSYSPFESSFSAGTAIVLCTFFLYYRERKSLMLLSFIFALATFKRAAVVFAILMLILPVFIQKNKKIGNGWTIAIKSAFTLITVGYYWLLTSEKSEWVFQELFHKTAVEFTMGRSQRLVELLQSGFESYGFASIYDATGVNLEMDFIKIYLELSIIAVLVLICAIVDLGHRQLYCTLLIVYTLVNMLTSHSLYNNFGWTLRLMVIGCILYKNEKDISFQKYLQRFQKYKIVLRGEF